NQGGVGVGLSAGSAAVGAVIAADAASAGGQVYVVVDEDGKAVGSDLRQGSQEALQLGVEGVDVHGADFLAGQERIGDDRTLRRGDGDRLRGQNGRSSQHVVMVGVDLHELPEVAALIGVNVLGLAQVHAALHEINAGGEQGRAG